MEKYFVIRNSEGETYVDEYDKEQLIAKLEEFTDPEFADKKPNKDTNYWGDKMLIIKGKVIVPKSKEVIKTFSLE